MEYIAIAFVAFLIAYIAVAFWARICRGVWRGYRRYTPLVFGLSFIATFVYGAAQL